MRLALVLGDVALAGARALVLPVDGAICRLGSAAGRALLATLPREERLEAREMLEDDLVRLRPIPPGEARLVPGCGAFDHVVVAAALLHPLADGRGSRSEMRFVLRRAVASALEVGREHGLPSVAMTAIGDTRVVLGDADGHRLPARSAVDAVAEGLAAARAYPGEVAWCFVEEEKLAFAREACERLGLAPRQ
jgi:hypothetical protein